MLNDGINWNCEDNIYWKHDVQRFEACKIVLHGNAEFEAKDVTLQVRTFLLRLFGGLAKFFRHCEEV